MTEPSIKKIKLEEKRIFTLYFDGCSKGNPGKGGCGWIFGHDQYTLAYGWKLMPRCTNNESEYEGVLEGLKHVTKTFSTVPHALIIRGDSELVIRQLQGRYKVKAANLKLSFMSVMDMIVHLRRNGCTVTMEHIPRENNQEADYLSNLPLVRERDGHFDLVGETRIIFGDFGIVDKAWLNKETN